MFVKSVSSTKDKIIYDLKQPLGEGATAKVWRGIDESDPSNEVAIKIAHKGTSPAQLQEFQQELEILETLAQTEAKSAVPWAHSGQATGISEDAIIIMELVPNEWQLISYINAHNEKLPEDLVFSTALQYAQLMVALHTRGYSMRGDRKVADLRWDANKERLIVLDWNRAGRLPTSESRQKDREALVRQDLRVFGQLWSELAIGHKVTDLPGVDDTTDPDWITIPRGIRIILARSLHSRSNWGFQSADELQEALKEYEHNYVLVQRNQVDLIRKIKSLYEQATADSIKQALLADKALTLIDLFEHIATKKSIEPDRGVLNLKPLIQALYSKTEQRVSEAVENIKRQVSRGYYAEAQQIASKTIYELQTQNGRDYLLRLNRWLLIAQVGEQGNQLAIDMTSFMPKLLDCVTQLEEMSNLKAENVTSQPNLILSLLRQVSNNIPDQLNGTLMPLELEITIRQTMLAAIQARGAPDQHRIIHTVLDYWRQLNVEDPAYAQYLRFDLEPLDNWLTQETFEASVSEDVELRRRNFHEAVEVVGWAFQNAASWPEELDNKLRSAQEAYVALSGYLTDEDKNIYNFVSWVSDANDCMTQSNPIEALSRLVEIPDSATTKEYKAIALSRCREEMLLELETIIQKYERKTQNVWPDELRKAQMFAHELEQSPITSKVDEILEQWAAKVTELRNRIFPDGTFSSYAQVLSSLDNRDIDVALEEAIRSKIEILDREIFLEKDIVYWQVETLGAAREARRLTQQVDNLALEANESSDSLDKVLQILKTKLELVGNISGDWVLSDTVCQLEQLHNLSKKAEQITESAKQTIQNIARERKILEEQRGFLVNSQKNTQSEFFKAQISFSQAFLAYGLQAVREFNLDQAEEAYYKAEELTSSHRTDAETTVLNLLNESIKWLKAVGQAGILPKLIELRSALSSGKLQIARSVWKVLAEKLDNNPTLSSGWVLGELRSEYINLCDVDFNLRISEKGTIPSDVAIEHNTTEIDDSINRLKELEQETSDDYLDRYEEILLDLGAKQNLSAKQLLEFSNKYGWYTRRKQLVTRVDTLLSDWGELYGLGSETDFGKLKTLLSETESVLIDLPTDFPKFHLDQLEKKLRRRLSDDFVVIFQKSPLTFVLLGILHYQISQWGQHEDKAKKEILYVGIADELLTISSQERTLSGLSKNLIQMFESLARKNRLIPQNAAAQIINIFEYKKLEQKFERLKNKEISQSISLLELRENLQCVNKSVYFTGNGYFDSLDIQKWISWCEARIGFLELRNDWESLTELRQSKEFINKLQLILEQTNQLIVNLSEDIPSIYWVQLTNPIKKTYQTIMQQKFPAELTTWIGILYYRVVLAGNATRKQISISTSDGEVTL